MDFSELFKQAGNQCSFSPDGAYVAATVGHKLVIRDADTLAVVNVITAVDAISHASFSPCGKYLLIAAYDAGAMQVWPVEPSDAPIAKIDEGITGCVRAIWDPLSGRSILSWSAFGLRISIWSLVDGSLTYIQQPKVVDAPADGGCVSDAPAERIPGCAFRKDFRYMAVLDRVDGRDFVNVYDCIDWELVKRFQIDTTDASNIAWSPEGRFIAVTDSVFEFKVLIYSPDGHLLHPPTRAADHNLGIRSLAWSPTGQFLAVGSYDQTVSLLNHYTFNSLVDWSLEPTTLVLSRKQRPTVYFESIDTAQLGGSSTDWPSAADLVRPVPPAYSVVAPPTEAGKTTSVTLAAVKTDANTPITKLGVSALCWSPDGRYLAVKCQNKPSTIFIYSAHTLRLLAVLRQAHSIKHMAWRHAEAHKHTLVFCTGADHLYLWHGPPDTAAADEEADDEEPAGRTEFWMLPHQGFAAHSFMWSNDGKKLLVVGKAGFCLGFVTEAHDDVHV
ncbi:WD repeat-containing protein wrap73 [Allomyces arbusculus]|nr:WD repeat-containing protein wrap73 [Allomyces arbusculus]